MKLRGWLILLDIKMYSKSVVIEWIVGLLDKSNIKNGSEVDTSIFYILCLSLYMIEYLIL